jgi:hypothetical protein
MTEQDILDRAKRAAMSVDGPDHPYDAMLRRRDRKRRNQRIAAGVVGIAVFVAAVWIVTSFGSLDRSETSVGPAGEVTGPAETGPAETAQPPARASAAPDVVVQERCSAGAKARLELTDTGDRIKMRFEVHGSPPAHLWHIRMWRMRDEFFGTTDWREIWRGARVASDNGDFAVVRLASRYFDTRPEWGGRVKAIDSATGQVCHVEAWMQY